VLPLDRIGLDIGGGTAATAIKGTRPMFLPELATLVDVPVYDRYQFGPGIDFIGPAIVEERESTTIIGSGANVTVDALLNLVIQLPSAE
jgi:N-methylhydantoinase A